MWVNESKKFHRQLLWNQAIFTSNVRIKHEFYPPETDSFSHLRKQTIWMTKKGWLTLFLSKVKITLMYKYGNIYRTIINNPVVEWCSFMITSSSNPLAKMYLELIHKTAPALFHTCPFSVSSCCFFHHLNLIFRIPRVIWLLPIRLWMRKSFHRFFLLGFIKPSLISRPRIILCALDS